MATPFFTLDLHDRLRRDAAPAPTADFSNDAVVKACGDALYAIAATGVFSAPLAPCFERFVAPKKGDPAWMIAYAQFAEAVSAETREHLFSELRRGGFTIRRCVTVDPHGFIISRCPPTEEEVLFAQGLLKTATSLGSKEVDWSAKKAQWILQRTPSK
jgi:hypothetical protein